MNYRAMGKILLSILAKIWAFLVKALKPGGLEDDDIDGEALALDIESDANVPQNTTMLATDRRASAWFVVKSVAEPGSVSEILGDPVVIGSAPGSAIRLNHGSVAPSHALIQVQQGRYTLSDTGSRTGTWVNGKLVAGVILKDGSRVLIGVSELFLSIVTEPASGNSPEGNPRIAGGVLLVRSGPAKGQSFRFQHGDLVIGRSDGDADAQIDDSAISQRHALLRCVTQGCLLYDLGSTNGTQVNGVELQGVQLQNGDLIKFGEVEVQFVREGMS